MQHQTKSIDRPWARLAVLLAVFTAPLLADGFIVVPHPPRTGAGHALPPGSGQPPRPGRDQRHAGDDDRQPGILQSQPGRAWKVSTCSPLPAGAVIKDFSMWIDGRETRAELLDAAKARTIYEDIVRRLARSRPARIRRPRGFQGAHFPHRTAAQGKRSASPITRCWKKTMAPSPTSTR